MYRQVIIPNNTNLMLKIPANYVGRTVEVIAFPIEENAKNTRTTSTKEIVDFYNAINLDLSGFKFNREDAHER